MYKNVCLIPAKGASTRLPLKNILKINGKELIYYSISAALSSGLFDGHVYVSTESVAIKEAAEKHNAKVPYIRGQELSVDPAGVADVALDFLEKLPELRSYDNLFILLPTSPMIIKEDLIEAIKIFSEAGAKCLMSVSETEHNALRSCFVRDNQLVPLHADSIKKRSQELECTYHINGAVIIINIQEFLQNRTYMLSPIHTYVIPRERSVDIDTKLDYLWAKFLMENHES